MDVDIIVPDVTVAAEKLALNGFRRNPGSTMDRDTKVEIDLLPGGKKVDPGPLMLPMPTHVSDTPQVLALEQLISAKPTYLGRGIARTQDYADVITLVQSNQLPRDFSVAPEVRDAYQRMWDELHHK